MSEGPVPIVSVVIPTRNRLDLTRDALAGLRSQTLSFQSFEVIVVDNGSTDGAYEALAKEVDMYPFALRVVRSPNSENGPAPARNFGVSCAKGEIIAFTDSDCRPEKTWLQVGLSTFQQNPELDMLGGVVRLKPEQEISSFFTRRTVTCETEHPTYPTANAWYRKSVFLENNGFDESLSFPNILGQSVEAADTDLAWRVKEGGGKTQFIETSIVYHEVQVLPWFEWLTEPLRLFLLPSLVRMHPGLKDALLAGGVFFYPPSIVYYILFLILIFALLFEPRLLFCLLLGLLLVSLIKAETKSVYGVLKKAGMILLNTFRIYIMSGALIYGSIRYRTLVL